MKRPILSTLGPLVQYFFAEHLAAHKRASPKTVISYRDTFRLLLHFLKENTGKAPAALSAADLDAPNILEFLDHLEKKRNLIRHGTAMALLQSGVHIEVIALYLGHEHLETTRVYVEADLAMKEEALKRIAPVLSPAQRFPADDTLLAFLDSL